MPAFLITWTADGWPHQELMKLVKRQAAVGSVTTRWRFQAIRQASMGDTVFLLKQGNGAKGIFGAGKIVGKPELKTDREGKSYRLMPVEFSRLVDPLTVLLVGEKATREILPVNAMKTQSSGVSIPDDAAARLAILVESEQELQLIENDRDRTRYDSWSLQPGDEIERKALHKIFGGNSQSGISPSRISPNVMIFSDPKSGEPHGYVDSWQDDGCFHYTGEGRRGDQRMDANNAAVLNHRQES